MAEAQILQDRLRNCLESILEVEEDLRKAGKESLLHNEFVELRNMLAQLDQIRVDEPGLLRLERLTTRILAESTVLVGEVKGHLGSRQVLQ